MFYYDTEGDASFNQINVINKVEVFKDSSFNISYDALTETGTKPFVLGGNKFNPNGNELKMRDLCITNAKHTKVLRFTQAKNFIEFENLSGGNATFYLRNLEAYYKMKTIEPEQKKVSTTKADENNNSEHTHNESLPSYAEVRGTLIQETSESSIENMLGKPDDYIQNNGIYWSVYFFKVQKSGEVGHLSIRYNWRNHVIDKIEFIQPGDRIWFGYTYMNSPVTKNN